MKTITYNLRLNGSNSSDYYSEIKTFSKQVFEKIAHDFGDVIGELTNYIETTKVEKTRSDAEYAVELLTIGMTWNRYLGASQRTSSILIEVLTQLYKLRSSNQSLKPRIDRLRGWLTGVFILNKINKPALNGELTFSNYNKLIKWLKATGEFKDEVKRLAVWFNFFKSISKGKKVPYLPDILKLFDWFRDEAILKLGKYTKRLENFLTTEYKTYKFREDVLFCGKDEVEYHLNMVGSEIINWGFESQYKRTKEKVLLVPACMQVQNGKACKAIRNGLDIQCSLCNKNCRINQLTQLGKQNNFNVFIVPHSSNFTKWLKKWENSEKIGLVAVACLLNLVPGGYEMRELNIPAQCVLLDYCGCKKHWHSKGVPTDINQERLLELVN